MHLYPIKTFVASCSISDFLSIHRVLHKIQPLHRNNRTWTHDQQQLSGRWPHGAWPTNENEIPLQHNDSGVDDFQHVSEEKDKDLTYSFYYLFIFKKLWL